jgi:hypothetical protein
VIKFRIIKSGLNIEPSDTVAFVRDSFSKNWKLQPGTSVTFRYKFYMDKNTKPFWRFLGKTWNFIDPGLGVNMTLLDFDEDKKLEIGLGPVLSIFKGVFYIGVGWNFSTSRSKNRYAIFGISIIEVTTFLKNIISKK